MLTTMDIWSAAEARSLVAPVVRLFVTALSRSPTIEELAPWVRHLRTGGNIGDIARTVAAGPEFLRRQGPDGPPRSHYVRALFWAIDGRDPPDGEIDRLLAQPHPTRASLLAQVSQSARARAAITIERNLYGNRLEPGDDVAYQLWLEGGGEAAPLSSGPIPDITVSIILLADAARPDRLRRTLASLAAQTSPHWEAVVVTAPETSAHPPVCAAAPDDRRINRVAGTEADWAGLNTTAARRAAGALVGFIAAGDELAPAAVEAAARLAARHPALRLLYTDEDRIAGDGTRSGVVLKGGWSPDLLLSGDALGQLVLFRRTALLDAGGLSAEAGEFALLDAALRLTHDAQPGAAIHLPGILFHRGSPAALFPQCRTGNGVPRLDAVIDRFLADHRPGLKRTRRQEGSRVWPAFTAALPSPPPAVSVIVPTKDRAGLLWECLDGLLGTTSYPALEVLIVDNGTTEPEALALIAATAADPRVRVLRIGGPFNWSALNNAAAAVATGDVLVLLNNDVSGMAPDWLSMMVGHVMRTDVGVVGARLLFPGGTLQHGGVLFGPEGQATHALAGAAGDDPGYLAQVALLRDLSAVTGACLAIRKSVFQEIGGLEQDHLQIAWSDIDLCLRVREAGYRVIWDPTVSLVHREVGTRGQDVTLDQQARHQMERGYARRRWPAVTERDPYLNPALSAAPGAMLLRARADRRPVDPVDAPADRVEYELQLRCMALTQALAESEAEVSNLRGAWPWAELQHLQIALEDADAKLRSFGLRAELHAKFVDIGMTLQHRARRIKAVWRLIRRLANAIRRSPARAALLRQRKADYAVIAASPVFDRAWYRATVMACDRTVDPVSHYLWQGAPAGRNPHALFDGAWYASRVPDLGLENPFAHYLRLGMAADADPHPLFDTRFYLTQAPEAARQALHHYWTVGAKATRSPSPLFDAFDNPAGLAEWAVAGAAADRDPHALFSAAWYRQTHLGGDRTIDPLAHWMRTGAAAGLPTNPYGLGSAWVPGASACATAPVATVIVQPGRIAVETTRTLISLIRDRSELPFHVVLAEAGLQHPRHSTIRTAHDTAAAVASAKGRYLLFLGPGAVAHEGWFEALVETAAADPAIGIVGSRTLDEHGALRSAGATIHDDGSVQHEGRGDDPELPRHQFARSVDAVDAAAMLVRREAWDAASPFDTDYQSGTLHAAALALALRAAGWRIMVQPASTATIPGEIAEPAAPEVTRFTRRWATVLSQLPPAGRNAAWRAAARRTLVLVDAMPAPDAPDAETIRALLQPNEWVALHAAEPCPDPSIVSGWERLGVELIRPPVALSAWLQEFGPYLDETVSFRAPAEVPSPDLLRWTTAPIRQRSAPPPLEGGRRQEGGNTHQVAAEGR